MSVEVSTILVGVRSVPGSGQLVQTAADTFVRANTLQGLGSQDYIEALSPNTSTNLVTVNINVNQMRFAKAAAGGGGNGLMIIPWRAMPSTWGRPQFSQGTFAGNTGVNATGPAVMFTPGGLIAAAWPWQCYNINVLSNITCRLQRQFGITGTDLTADLVIAPGDILRLSVTPSAGSNDLIVRRNGAIVALVSDIIANRPILTGSVAFYGRYVDTPIVDSALWSGWSFGVGL